MLRESTKSPSETVVAVRIERVPLAERAMSLLYIAVFGLMVTVLWAMGEAQSLEAKTIHCPPFPPEMIRAAEGAGNVAADAPPGPVQAPTDRSTSSIVVSPSATSW